MVKNLKEQLKIELKRMQDTLVAAIKNIIGEEEVVNVTMNHDLTRIVVEILKKETAPTLNKETRFIFSRIEEANPSTNEVKTSRLFSGTSTNLIIDNGKIIGSFISETPIDLMAIQSIFATVEHFKQKEEGESEEATPPKIEE